MDWADSASAIDDSYEPIGPHSQSNAAHISHGEPLTLENLGHNGPRIGHWTVKSTVVGSAIDNGCPTVHASLAERLSAAGHVRPVKGDMVERLAKATLLERQKDEMMVEGESVWDAITNQQAAPTRFVSLEARPKGFYIPKRGNCGIIISSKNGKTEVVRTPEVVPTPVVNTSYRMNSLRKCQIHETAEVQERTHTVTSDRVQSVASQASQQARHRVRIVGKNGEETFATLPPMRSTSQSMSGAMIHSHRQSPEEKTIAHENSRENTAKRDAHAAKVAQQMRNERAQQKEMDRKRAEAAKVAVNTLESGTLPKCSKTSSHASTASMRSNKSSDRHSAIALHGIFGDTSKPPSAASSKTSVQLSQNLTSVVSQHKSSGRSLSSQRRISSSHGWQDIGTGVFDATTSARQGSGWTEAQRPAAPISVHPTPYQSISNESKSVRSRETMKVTSHHSQQRSSHQSASRQASRPISQHSSSAMPDADYPATIYAGRGWISPHPLSVAPTEFQAPPDQAIRIPSQNGEPGETTTMTYLEWKALQQSEEFQAPRRNFSRSTSGAGAYIPGSWGHRDVEETGSMRSHKSQRAYQSPMVESVRSGQTYEHEFDGAREVDGQTYLRMPWDNREEW